MSGAASAAPEGGVPGEPAAGECPAREFAGEVVSVQPDVSGIDRSFDYLAPEGPPPPGAIVRVPLSGRRVHGWVLGAGAPPRPGLRQLERVLSIGPAPDLVELARYGAWRYAGRLRPFLLAGSPPRLVAAPAGPPPTSSSPPAPAPAPERAGLREALRRCLLEPLSVLRLPPLSSRQALVEEAIGALGLPLLVLCAERRDVELLGARLRRSGLPVALHPEDFAEAAGGGRVVLGSRAGAFAPAPGLRGVVVLDAHAEAYREERVPTWDATVLVAERARRAGVPCVLVSPAPRAVDLARATLVTLPAAEERAGWPPLQVLDRRADDPVSGLYSPQLAPALHGALEGDPGRPVVCVLNRTGRARLLACGTCGELVRCEHCGGALRQGPRPGEGATLLLCPVCGATRPVVCASCGARRLRTLRIGAERAAEELAALLGVATGQVGAARTEVPEAPVLVGTEAVLHRVARASLVCFLDFDQELLAPRYLAAEQAMALVVRAARLVAGRRPPSGFVRRLLVQSRLPGHEVLAAATAGDPGPLAESELARRAALRLPPASALALLSGEGVSEAAQALGAAGLEVAARDDGSVVVRAPDAERLAEELGALGPTLAGQRIEVDPISL